MQLFKFYFLFSSVFFSVSESVLMQTPEPQSAREEISWREEITPLKGEIIMMKQSDREKTKIINELKKENEDLKNEVQNPCHIESNFSKF